MEQGPEKSKIEVPEIQGEIAKSDKLIEYLTIGVERALDDLEFTANKLEGLIIEAEMIVADRNIESYQKDHAIPESLRVTTSYTPEKEQRIREQIAAAVAKISLLKKRVENLQSSKEDIEQIKQHLAELEQEFNEFLVRIPPAQAN